MSYKLMHKMEMLSANKPAEFSRGKKNHLKHFNHQPINMRTCTDVTTYTGLPVAFDQEQIKKIQTNTERITNKVREKEKFTMAT